ncbi:hypothetical protein [Afipia sp. P52-10]|uniref:hypothetical protein n=1 Tax=Afipia sp. P52-10 TaxID=1429916 RepID=UPI0019D32D7D|nr:hypothetical protein [Afipia sp. P52-10]
MSDGEIVDRIARFGYRVSVAQIAFTSEPVEDFREARLKRWFRAGAVKVNEPGLLVIEDAQPRPGQRTRDVIVIGLGATRVVMGVEIKPGAPPLAAGSALCRYAPTMEWGAEVKPAPSSKLKSRA